MGGARGEEVMKRRDVHWVWVGGPWGEGEAGSSHSGESKGRQGLVDAADHDAGFVVPVRDVASVREGAADVPEEEGHSEHPEDGEEEVAGAVGFGGEG